MRTCCDCSGGGLLKTFFFLNVALDNVLNEALVLFEYNSVNSWKRCFSLNAAVVYL